MSFFRQAADPMFTDNDRMQDSARDSEEAPRSQDSTVVNAQSIDRLVLQMSPSDPQQSPEYRKATEVSGIFLVLGLGLSGIAAIGLLAGESIYRTLWLDAYVYNVICISGFFLGVIFIGVGQYVRVRARLKYFSTVAAGAQERATDEYLRSSTAAHDPDDLAELLISTREQMRFYDAMARGQASKAFYLSVVAMVAGFVIIAVGIIIALREANTAARFTAAGLSAIGTLTSGYISKTFLEMHNRTLRQLNFYFQQPLVQSHTLMAKRLSKDLSDSDRDAAIRAIINSLLVNVSRPGETDGAQPGEKVPRDPN